MIQVEKRTSGLVPSDLYFNGQKIYLDVDEDSYLYAPSDDVLALILGGSVKATFSATGLQVPTGGGIELYNTADEVTNYERLRAYWNANAAYLTTEKGGTGTRRNLTISSPYLQLLCDAAGWMTIGSNQHLYIDLGGSIFIRDYDAAYAVRATIASGTGYARFGDATAPTVSLEAANGFTVAAGILSAGQIQGISASGPVILSQRTSSVTNAGRATTTLEHKTSADMVDGFATDLFFKLTDDAASIEAALISVVRAGADANAKFVARANKGFAFSLATSGAVDIGTHMPVRVQKTYTADLFDAAGLTDSATIWTQPANTTLMAIVMRLTTQFAGPSLTDMRVTMGLAGDPDGLLVTTGNLISDAAATEYANVGAYQAAFMAGLHGPTAAAIPWVAYATATGCDMDDLTAGQLDFYVLYLEP